MKGILVFGDSIVWGRGEEPSLGWVGRLKNLFEKEDFYHAIYNLGIPGDTSTSLLQRIGAEAAARIHYIRPDDRYRIVIAIGTNDARHLSDTNAPQTHEEQFRTQVKKIISIAQEYTRDVIVLGLLQVDERRTTPYEKTLFTNQRQQRYSSILAEEAKRAGATFVNLFNVFDGFSLSEVLIDGLHPSNRGYEIIARFLQSKVLARMEK